MRCGGLYGAAAASLLLAPTTLAKQARHVANEDAVPTAFVTLNVPNKGKTTEALTFRLDVAQSDYACDNGNLRINGHRLNQTVNGGGQGVISRSGDPAVKANWLFSCLQSEKAPYDQVVSVTVYEIDGRPIEPTGFETFFRQRHPVSIVDIDGAAVVNRLHTLTVPRPETQEQPLIKGPDGPDNTETESTPTSATSIQDDLQTKIQELDLLRIQARRLGDLIFEKEQAIAQLLGKKPPVPSVKVDNCESIRCVLSYLSRKFKGATGTFGEDLEELKSFVADADEVHLPTPDDLDADFWRATQVEDDVESENAPEVYEITNKDGSWEWEEEIVLTAEEVTELQEADRHTHRFHRRQPRLLTAIALAAIAICPEGSCQSFFQSILSQWRSASRDNVEKATGEKAEEEEVDNTMEEEIAQFREAAAMVGDIVAAEEGRARRTRQDRYTNDVEGEDVDSPPSRDDTGTVLPKHGTPRALSFFVDCLLILHERYISHASRPGILGHSTALGGTATLRLEVKETKKKNWRTPTP
ncbi:hypothetical protein ACCO45_010916 [Purpureocillium lilacinum]|uniref:Uncharacterized protein n=1 Tax=Purpureocillium lilacinum TaxID=33203 RepID=A0ACC4DH42_PURLI